MKNILGYLNKGIGSIIDYVLKFFIFIVEILVNVFSSVRQLFGYILSMGGCLLIFFIFNPVGLMWILSNKLILGLIAFSIIVPILGKITVSYLKYIHYMATEYFYDKADNYLLGRKASFENIKDYGNKYREDLEEKRKKEAEAERKRREEEWKRKFENGQGGTYWNFGDFSDFEDFFNNAGSYQGNFNGQYNSGGYSAPNMGMSFEKEYENACSILNVSSSADKYEIKLAYKKMAKKYHPDLNKDEGATEMFQKINNAYSFLSDDNIERYKRIKGK